MSTFIEPDVGFWQEVFLNDQDHKSAHLLIGDGGLPADRNTLKSLRSHRPLASPGKKAKKPRRPAGHSIPLGTPFEPLSPKECRMVEMIAAGYTIDEMAQLLSLSRSSICRRTARILGKLGVANKLELILFAMNHGILSPMPKHPV